MIDNGEAELTIGVAIAIPQPHARVLSTWRRRVGDPAAELIWPHVTLLPPTPISPADLPGVEAHLNGAADAAAPFVMHLSGTGTFRPTSPVVYVQVSRGVSECELLEAAVRTGPLAREIEFPYHPHVTVAQEISDAALDEAYDGLSDFVARFPVDHIVLFSRGEDRRWQWRTEFTLGGTTRVEG